ncbi:ABC transporter ATP-binding protein [Flavobacterium sp.]|uniref:ABC transporter ATP-binding protein n=1 Tax=Flavobacterium sp. TaxID=239 RepID=UPI0038FC862B
MLELDSVFYTYIDNPVIKNVSFSVSKGNNVAIIGESGSGKSTLLKLIYGLYDLDQGEIRHNGKQILGPKFNLIPGEDFIKYLAQDFDLMPYISVEENVGKFLSNIYKDQKKARVAELLELVEMTEFAKVKAKYLSGGQQQRVALARVLALEPKILLLDEPFSQIDSFRKNKLRRNIFSYLKEKQISCIVATHDSIEALSFSDETIVIKNGEMIAKDSPKTLFDNPLNSYIAALFGEVNQIPSHWFNKSKSSTEMMLVYPHQLKIVENSEFSVIVNQSYFKGSHYLIESRFINETIFFDSSKALQIGKQVFLNLIY